MKNLTIVLVPVLAWLAWSMAAAQPEPASASDPPIAWKGPPPDLVVTDQAAVFKRAFWRAPSAGDEVLHAVRHEWRDAEGVTKWQWFIAVKASPALLKYLRDDNAFGLLPAKSARLPGERPAWFSFDPGEVSVFKSPRGKMQLVFLTQNHTLYATDAGGGLQRGAPEPVPAVPPAQATSVRGRIPTTPPPTPKP